MMMYDLEQLKHLAEVLRDNQHKRLNYTKERIPVGGPKGSLKSTANRLANELDAQQYYKDEGVRDFLSFIAGYDSNNAGNKE